MPMIKPIRPTVKQAEAYHISMQDDKLVTLFGGAVGGGKTFWLILNAFAYAMKYPNARIYFVRETAGRLTRILKPSISKCLDLGLNIVVKKSNASGYELINGSVIELVAEGFNIDKDLGKFRGAEPDAVCLDEIDELQEATFFKMIERVGRHKGFPPKIFCTCNPTDNYVKSIFYDRWVDNSLPSNWAYVPSKITDNPHLPASYLDNLKATLPP